MKDVKTLAIGVSLIVLVNGIALGGIAYNRSGEPESRLHLTERELYAPHRSFLRNAENSGVSLDLRWRVPVGRAGRDEGDESDDSQSYDTYTFWGNVPPWLDREKLIALGFTALPEKDDPDAYNRRVQKTREVLIVFELDGRAARQARERAREYAAERERLRRKNPGVQEFELNEKSAQEELKREEENYSRLFAIDAGVDLTALRARYPDRSRFLIARGQVQPQFITRNKRTRLMGYLSALSVSSINVPVQFQSALPRDEKKPAFTATVAFGQRLEPWLIDLQAGKGGAP